MPNHNEEHTALVKAACEALAVTGLKAWPTPAGAAKTEAGWYVKYGKKGGGDITGIIPVVLYGKIWGIHAEYEAKTGDAVQNKNQRDHEKYIVLPTGGFYFVFRCIPSLIDAIRDFQRAAEKIDASAHFLM